MPDKKRFFNLNDPNVLKLPSSSEEVKVGMNELQRKLHQREISGGGFFINSIFLFGSLVQGGNPNLVDTEVLEFLTSQEIQGAYQKGLVGEALGKTLSLGFPRRNKKKNERTAREFWRENTVRLPEEVLPNIEELVFSEKKAREVLIGFSYNLPDINFSLRKMAIGLSTLTSLRDRLVKRAKEIINTKINVTVSGISPGQFCQNNFKPELFYLLGLTENINNQISKIGQEAFGDNYILVRSILATILFARVEGVTPETGFKRFVDTKTVFDNLNKGEIVNAKTELKKVIVRHPWNFHQHDVDGVFDSGRIDLRELKKREIVPIEKENPPRERPTGIKANIALFRELVGQYPATGTVIAWWSPDQDIKSEDPSQYFYIGSDPEGPSRKKGSYRFKVIEGKVENEQLRVKIDTYELHFFAKFFLREGTVEAFGKIKELSQNRGEVPSKVLEVINKTLIG